MVKVKIFRENDGIKGFEISGHASHKSDDEKYDLVCAGVSSISIAAFHGLVQYLGLQLDNPQIRDGYMLCLLPKDIESSSFEKAQAILETMALGLEAIAESFPKHVKFV